MKLVKYLLVFYALFLIAGGPLLLIAGNLYHRQLISGREYLVATLCFVVALLLYFRKDKKAA